MNESAERTAAPFLRLSVQKYNRSVFFSPHFTYAGFLFLSLRVVQGAAQVALHSRRLATPTFPSFYLEKV